MNQRIKFDNEVLLSIASVIDCNKTLGKTPFQTSHRNDEFFKCDYYSYNPESCV